MLEKLEKILSPKNYIAYLRTKYELAQIKCERCERSDTSTPAGANKALNDVRNAKVALGQAQAAAERYNYDFGQEDLDAIVLLKAKLESQEYTFSSQAGLLQAENDMTLAERDAPDARLSEAFKPQYLGAIDLMTVALTNAVNSQDHALQARVYAKLGFVVYQCLHKTQEQELQMLKRSLQYYIDMRKVVSEYFGGEGGDNQLGEAWFLLA